MPVRAVIYARLSDDRDGRKVGVQNQLDDCRQLAEARGWTVQREFKDMSTSASKKTVTRPAYNEMVAAFRVGEFDALLCWDLDRLTRQPRQLEDWIDAAEDRGLLIVTANGEADLSTDGGRLFARMKAAVGKGEAERNSARVKRNVLARQEAGRWHGGQVPFGYQRGGDSIVPDPAERAFVDEAARRLLAGDTMYGITQDWNARGVSTRGGFHWRQSNLRAILTNRTLIAETKSGAAAQWEPILDRRTFDRLASLFADPSRKVTHSPGVKGSKYSMAGGLSVCGRCGKRLITTMQHGRPALKCTKIVNGDGACGSMVIGHDDLETYVFDVVMKSLNEKNPRLRTRLAEQDPADDAKIAQLEAHRDDLRDQKSRADDLFIRGALSEREHAQHVERVRVETDETTRQIDALLGTSIMTDALADGLDWRSWSPERRRNFLRVLIQRVEVHEFPKGMGSYVRQRSDETAEEFADRKLAHRDTLMGQRVTIIA